MQLECQMADCSTLSYLRAQAVRTKLLYFQAVCHTRQPNMVLFFMLYVVPQYILVYCCMSAFIVLAFVCQYHAQCLAGNTICEILYCCVKWDVKT